MAAPPPPGYHSTVAAISSRTAPPQPQPLMFPNGYVQPAAMPPSVAPLMAQPPIAAAPPGMMPPPGPMPPPMTVPPGAVVPQAYPPLQATAMPGQQPMVAMLPVQGPDGRTALVPVVPVGIVAPQALATPPVAAGAPPPVPPPVPMVAGPGAMPPGLPPPAGPHAPVTVGLPGQQPPQLNRAPPDAATPPFQAAQGATPLVPPPASGPPPFSSVPVPPYPVVTQPMPRQTAKARRAAAAVRMGRKGGNGNADDGEKAPRDNGLPHSMTSNAEPPKETADVWGAAGSNTFFNGATRAAQGGSRSPFAQRPVDGPLQLPNLAALPSGAGASPAPQPPAGDAPLLQLAGRDKSGVMASGPASSVTSSVAERRHFAQGSPDAVPAPATGPQSESGSTGQKTAAVMSRDGTPKSVPTPVIGKGQPSLTDIGLQGLQQLLSELPSASGSRVESVTNAGCGALKVSPPLEASAPPVDVALASRE